MKKLYKFSLTLFLSLALLFVCATIKPQTKNASAAGVVTITVAPIGGTPSVETLQTNSEGKIEVLPTVERAGFYFDGWFKENTFENKVTTETVFENDAIIYAKWATKTNKYVISQNAELFSIIGSTTGSGVTYVLAKNIADLSTVIDAIAADVDNLNTEIGFTFNTVTLDETINIPYANITISGTISSSAETAFNISATNKNVSLTNVTLSGTSARFVNFESISTSSTVNFANCTFDSSAEIEYGFEFESSNYTLNFSGLFTHSSTYLYHHFNGIDVYMENILADNSSISLTTAKTNYYTEIISSTNKNNLNKINVYSLNNFYKIEKVLSGSALVSNSYINVSYDLSGGAFKPGFKPETLYYALSTEAKFPALSDITLAHHRFSGWIGVLTLSDDEKTTYSASSNTYYFNKAMLQSFVDAGSNYSLLDTHFSTTIPETASDGYFTKYAYDSSRTSLDFLAMTVFENLSKAPTFKAVYKNIEYSVTVVSNTDTSVPTIKGNFGDAIAEPTGLLKEGHSLAGWFEDETFLIPFSFSTMPDTNPTVYAKWTPNTYTVTLFHNNETTNKTTIDVVFGETINFPAVTYTGRVLDGYYSNEQLTQKFTAETMPAENITLYIGWKLKQVTIYLDSRCSAILDPVIATYGTPITEPTPPNNPGYTFFGWYTSTEYTTQFDFSVMPEYDTMAYARWIQNPYTITFNSNGGSQVSAINRYYGEEISAPSAPVKKGYSFVGWFTEDTLENTYTFTNMPAENITLYAKWAAKAVMNIPKAAQTFSLSDTTRSFVPDTTFTGFVVRYLVNGEWTTTLPTEVGKYDVNIFRAEDENYSEVNITIENGYVLNNKVLNLVWLALILYFLFIVEIAVVIVIRKMRKKKQSEYISFAVVFPFGIITGGQFAAILVGLALFIFGFVMVVYELVKLHRTVPNEEVKPSEFDNVSNASKKSDLSENVEISKRVTTLLQKEFAEAYERTQKDDVFADPIDKESELTQSQSNTSEENVTPAENNQNISETQNDTFDDENKI